ncbi:MAG: hypothetical protein KDD64_04040 [Bdellovibrionales bacterium]|nr:hypothetical protein [Bdellovibrionales bacterium]
MGSSLETLHITCLRMILYPVASFCIRRGLSLQDIIESLKFVLVRAASKELKHGDAKVNASRISIMTGLHRTEVSRMLKGEEEILSEKNFLRRVIGLWREGTAFTTSSGKPRVLSYDGEGSEFWQLVQAVSLDPNPASILRELLRSKAVEQSSRGVKLVRDFQLAQGNPEQAYRQLGADMQSMIEVVESNMLGTERVPGLHLRTEFDNVFEDDVPSIRKWILAEGTKFHQRVRHFLATYDADISSKKSKGKAGARVSVTSFCASELSEVPERASD